MTAHGVTVSARADGDVVLIVVSGEIDLANAEFVEQQLASAISNRTMKAAVDLSDVAYVDSIGMRVLFALALRLETAQIEFKLIAPIGSPARRVIEISGLDSIVTVEPVA
jgi:stage II sporulation protein AA (anti-sigma F factor antagonist)